MALLSTKAIAKDRISPAIASLCANPTFMSGLIAWAIAQLLKVFTTFFVEKRWDWKMAVGSGGMPSSHSALCVALTTSVAICHGISDALFPVCLGFSLIVMYDATGVRRHAGMQAEVRVVPCQQILVFLSASIAKVVRRRFFRKTAFVSRLRCLILFLPVLF
jgi:acid phosphatase family membrane protein YuiD